MKRVGASLAKCLAEISQLKCANVESGENQSGGCVKGHRIGMAVRCKASPECSTEPHPSGLPTYRYSTLVAVNCRCHPGT